MPQDDYFKEVKELFREVAERQKENEKLQKENRKQIKDTQKQVWETQKQVWETQKQVRETQKEVRDTQKEIKTLKAEVSKIVGGWGMFVEGLVAPGVPKLLKKVKINIKSIYLNVETRLNGRQMEVDVMGVGTKDGKGIVVACSIKSRLQMNDVQETKDRLDSFFDFFPEYADREVIGLVGGIRIDEGVDKYAERQGFYIIGSSGEVVKLLNKKDFTPKVWRIK